MIIQLLIIIGLLLCVRPKRTLNESFWNVKETSAAKGFLILLIVIYHSSFDLEIHKGMFQVVDNYISAIAVALFSFLSAYAIEIKYAKGQREFYKWLIRKFTYIIVIYLIAIGIKILMGIPIDSAGMMWINAFLLSYLVEGISHKLLGKRAWTLIVLFWAAYSIVVHVIPNPIFWWPHQSLGFAYGRLFYILLSKIKLPDSKICKIVTMCFGTLLAFIMIYLYMMNGAYPDVNVVMQIERNVATLMMLVVVVQAMFFVTIQSKILEYLGRISLYVFFIHGIWVEKLKTIFSGTLYVLIVVCCTMLSAVLVHYIIMNVINIGKNIARDVLSNRK